MISIKIRNCTSPQRPVVLVLMQPLRWVKLADPNVTPPRNERGLFELFKEIRTTVGEEAQIVQVVFPNPPLVMQVFLQRVFAQSVSKCSHFPGALQLIA